MLKTIGVVGPGYVGMGIYKLFGNQVQAMYSPSGKSVPKEFKNNKLIHGGKKESLRRDTKEAVNKCNFVVISAPTPMSEDGSCDISAVEEAASWITVSCVLIKSTIPPGTTDYLNKKYGERFAFSPEYMGEGHYYTPPWKYPDPMNMESHTFQIFGGSRKVTKEIVDIFIRRMGPHVFFAQTNALTAEFVKYFENVWGAMKVSFANEMFECAEKIGVDYREARELWALDSRVEKMHTAVFPDKRGWSGKCYPKDLRAFIHTVEKAGYNPKLLKQVWNTNTQWHLEFSKI